MARIRTVKPEFWSDEKLAECSRDARLLFIGTWNFADDEGRMEYSPKRLKMQIFPGDTIDVAPLVTELAKAGLVILYRVADRDYLQIPRFRKHQRIDHPQPSTAPAPSQEHSATVRGTFPESSANALRTFSESSGNDRGALAPEGNGREWNGREESKAKTCAPESGGARLTLCEPEQTRSAIQHSTPTKAQLDLIYKLYPRKRAPFEAKKAIRKAVGQVMNGDSDHPAMPLPEALDHLVQKVTRYAQCVQGSDRTLIPYPATWFNRGEFWGDETDWKPDEGNGSRKPNARRGDEEREGYLERNLRQNRETLALTDRLFEGER